MESGQSSSRSEMDVSQNDPDDNYDFDNPFKCVLCLDTFKNPRLLPCGHSYCSYPKPCLKNLLLRHPRKCAVCREHISGNITDEKRYTFNYALASAIETIESRKDLFERHSHQAESCPMHNNDKVLFCRSLKCSVQICQDCWKANHIDKNEHEVVPFEKIVERVVNSKTPEIKNHQQLFLQVSSQFVEANADVIGLMNEVNKLAETQETSSDIKTLKELKTYSEDMLEALKKQKASIQHLKHKFQAIVDENLRDSESQIDSTISAFEKTVAEWESDRGHEG